MLLFNNLPEIEYESELFKIYYSHHYPSDKKYQLLNNYRLVSHKDIKKCPNSISVLKNTNRILNVSKNKKIILQKLERVLIINTHNQIKRLNNWFDFFLLNETTWTIEIDYFIITLLNFYILDGEIHTQTHNEFLTSKLFLEEYLIEKISFENKKTIHQIFLIAIIIGCNPWLQQMSVRKALKCIETKELNEDNIINFFNVILAKHTIPKYLISNLLNYNYRELKCIEDLLNGKNLRNSKHIPLSLSKKESKAMQLLSNADIPYKVKSIAEIIIISKIISPSNKYSEEAISAIINVSKTYNNLNVKANLDIKFLQDLYHFLLKFERAIRLPFDLDYCITYLEEQRKKTKVSILKRKSTKNILKTIENDFNKPAESEFIKWDKKYHNSCLLYKDKQYQFIELLSSEELYHEGQIMRHCVYTSSYSCSIGERAIFSLRQKSKGIKKPLLTIAIESNCVIEVKGKFNRRPSQKERLILNKWIKKMNFKLKTI